MNSDLAFVHISIYMRMCVCIHTHIFVKQLSINTELKPLSESNRDIIMKNDHFLSAYFWVTLITSVCFLCFSGWAIYMSIPSLQSQTSHTVHSTVINFWILNCNILWTPSLNCSVLTRLIVISFTYSVNWMVLRIKTMAK